MSTPVTRIVNAVIHVQPVGPMKEPARSGNPFANSVQVLGLYIRAQFLIGLADTVLYEIGFALARLPAWPVLAILCGVLGLIPYIGSLIGILLVLFAALAGGADWFHIAEAGGVWVAVQAIDGFWLTPQLLGKPLGLKPLAVFGAMIAGSLLLGPIGVIVAVPILAISLVWYRFFRERRTHS